MTIRNSMDSYGWLARFFHWTMALMIIGLLGVGLWMTDLEPPFKFQVYGVHKAMGIIVLGFAIWRLLWRFSNPTPALPNTLSPLQRFASHAVHMFLYLAMFAMPLTGWAMSSAAGYPVSVFGLFTMPDLVEKNEELAGLMNSTHEIIGYLTIAALAAHIGAALLHHFVFKDRILMRMLKG